MARAVARSSRAAVLPQWIPPQLTQLVDAAPEGDQWLHEIKFDGYRLHARLDHGVVTLLTRTGLDWTHKYPAIAKAVTALGARQAYLDGELCGIGPDGIPSFSRLQAASDAGSSAGLVLYLFDLLHLDGDDVAARPLIDRKTRLAALLATVSPPLLTSDHHLGDGPAFYDKACELPVEGIVSKRADAPYMPGNRGLWRKIKCLHREEFIIVGWTEPEGRRPWLGAVLLAYYDPDGRLTYSNSRPNSNWLSTVRTAQAIGLTIPQSVLTAPRVRQRFAVLFYRANGKNPPTRDLRAQIGQRLQWGNSNPTRDRKLSAEVHRWTKPLSR